ncbi:MAG: UDP-N-acetylmuramoyl-L-alanyl-D-glutamate--2,6-diaminopimelate ligase [Propionibacteriaceae bacterium]|jgi:UDP-N-acetylmuramoyl-L-alanyl-D-glutamate--2,6-diaminopimelate ligase|nr:UDP-N-acetylmuramoyl-L-alanyl-D-glutamate--2,6-diaminopimelate ligase [Propionibacteriaceae bacterium]
MVTAGDLLCGLAYEVVRGDADAPVADVAYDSRKAQPGGMFVAMPSARGPRHDGAIHLVDARARGARVFIVDQSCDLPESLDHPATVIRVPDTRSALAHIAAQWFGHPADDLTVVAITGTKGKTTASYLIRSILQAAGRRVGLIGSSGVLYDDTHVKLPNTTPESFDLHRIMAEMVAAGIEILVLEATSQGFALRRTEGIRFDIGVYTNISPDHISATEHASFAEYFAAKRQIFAQSNVCLVNRDASLYDQIVADAACDIATFGVHDTAGIRGSGVVALGGDAHLGTAFTCHWPQELGLEDAVMTVALPGEFNVSNALAAIGVTTRLGVDSASIIRGLATAHVPGRTEIVPTPTPYTVMIDFAHNALSIAALARAARQTHPRRLLAVFGLEGNRSRARRFDCGAVLGREFDHVILADASPRTDDPNQIIADIAHGIEDGGGAGKYEVIRDRRQAITTVLDQARPGDLILLIGKGDVPYEEIQGVNHPFDEREVVRQYFARPARDRQHGRVRHTPRDRYAPVTLAGSAAI